MDTPTQDIPKLEAIYTMEDIVKQIEASGVNLGDDPAKRINTFVDSGLLPRPNNGRFASFVVQRIIAIQNKLQEGKSMAELKEEVSKERRRFLNQVTDLNSMANLYHKFSSNSMFFLASLLLLAMVSIGILGAGLTGSSNPVVVAGESIVKTVLDAGTTVAKTAARPLGNTIVTIIKTAKPADSASADPLGLTNLEVETPIIPENLVQLDGSGNLILGGDITAGIFSGSGAGLTDLVWNTINNRPSVLSAIDGVQNDGGNVDLIAGSGITILPDDDANTITFSSIDNSSSQFIFKNIAVSGQSNIASDLNSDTLTLIAGSNVSLTTNASTDTLTIGVTGTIANADTLDLLDSTVFLRSNTSDAFTSGTLTFNAGTTLAVSGSMILPTTGISGAGAGSGLNADLLDSLSSAAFAALADNETVTGNWTFTSNTDPSVFIKPSSGMGGKVFKIDETGAGVEIFSITYFGDVEAKASIKAGAHLYTAGTIRVGNDGTLYNINAITATGTVNFGGATTITNDLTIGDGIASGDWLTMTATGIANVIATTPDSNRIILQGNYWDGGASQPVEMQIMTIVTDTAPSYRLSFMRGPGTEVARVESDGDFYANGLVSAGGILATGTGTVRTGASQLILEALGANADVVIQGGLCVRDATACNNVAAGGLEVDTAGGTGDDPGDVFDIAEIFLATEPIAKGEIVSAAGNGAVKRSSGEYDSALLGVTSTAPAALIDDGVFAVGVNRNKYNPNKPWVALVGRVPVKVSVENGDISPGDPLTSSSTPGVAMRATKSGPIIGKALEAYNGSGEGIVMVFVNTGWYVAPVDSSDDFVADLSSITDLDVTTLTATTVTANTIVTDELVVSSETSGNSEVRAAQNSITIENSRVKEDSKILVTFTSDYSPASRYWVTKEKDKSFNVHLDQPVTGDSSFDWLIIN